MKVGVILSGCGVYDGAEIHEAVITLLELDKRGVEAVVLAPNISQKEVINHISKEKMDEERNVLVESARIARGNIVDLKEVDLENLDGIFLPGGFGAMKNFSDLLTKGYEGNINQDVKRALEFMHTNKKPIGAVCIAPVIVAAGLKKSKISVTIGNDTKSAQTIEEMGCIHKNSPHTEPVVDEDNLVVTAPAYMTGSSIKEVAKSIEKAVEELVKLIKR